MDKQGWIWVAVGLELYLSRVSSGLIVFSKLVCSFSDGVARRLISDWLKPLLIYGYIYMVASWLACLLAGWLVSLLACMLPYLLVGWLG